jgi:hypothetical protein
MGSHVIHLAVPAGFHTSQMDLHLIYRVSNESRFSYNYFVKEEDNEANFSVPGATKHT